LNTDIKKAPIGAFLIFSSSSHQSANHTGIL